MAVINRAQQPTQIENASNNVLASTFDTNWQLPVNTLNDSSFVGPNGIAQDTGTANNYSVILPVGSPSSLNPGMMVCFLPANSNTGGSTLTVSPLGSAPILTSAGNALQGNEIQVNKMVTVIYNNVAPAGYRIIGHCALAKSLNDPGNVTVECAGYDSVSVRLLMNTLNSTLTLNHVSAGVPLNVMIQNLNASSTRLYGIKANNASGSALNVWTAFGAASTGAGFTQLNLSNLTMNANSLGLILTGMYNGTDVMFSV